MIHNTRHKRGQNVARPTPTFHTPCLNWFKSHMIDELIVLILWLPLEYTSGESIGLTHHWLGIQDHCNMRWCQPFYTALLAFTYFDRFLSSNSSAEQQTLNDIQECQLAFVSCLLISLKCHSGFYGNLYDENEEELSCMDMELSQALDWKLSGPISSWFLILELCQM